MPPGPKPRPPQQTLREGSPGRRPVREGTALPPSAPEEPDWAEWFPASSDHESELGPWTAHQEWSRVVPLLDKVGVLAEVDAVTLADYCVTVARIRQAERDISRRGIWVEGERGAQKNPSVTAANQYRTQLRFYVAELGLSPSSRSRLEPLEGDDDGDSPFD